MIRIKISVVIILVIITLGIFGFHHLDSKTQEVISMIDEVKEIARTGDIDSALAHADKLLKEWEDFHKYASVFVNNDKISVAQSSISRIKALIEEEVDELNAELDCAKSALKWIVESEIPRWTNIL